MPKKNCSKRTEHRENRRFEPSGHPQGARPSGAQFSDVSHTYYPGRKLKHNAPRNVAEISSIIHRKWERYAWEMAYESDEKKEKKILGKGEKPRYFNPHPTTVSISSPLPLSPRFIQMEYPLHSLHAARIGEKKLVSP